MNDDLKLGSIVVAFCAFLWFYAIPYHIKGSLPALLPRSLTLSMLIPCALFFYHGIRSFRQGKRTSSVRIVPGATLKALWVIPLMLIYIFLIDIVGFYATTCLFIFIFMWFFGARQSLGFYIYPVVVPFVVYLVIGRFLHFPFPEGVFF